jgi:hypothetical protein
MHILAAEGRIASINMTRTYVEPTPHAHPSAPAERSDAAATSASHVAVERPQKGLALKDQQGHRALVWRDSGAWIVESDHPALRRRVLRALKKPLSVWDCVTGPDGEEGCAIVQLSPDDPRYANQVFWHWQQLGLDDVAVDVVTLPHGLPPQ